MSLSVTAMAWPGTLVAGRDALVAPGPDARARKLAPVATRSPGPTTDERRSARPDGLTSDPARRRSMSPGFAGTRLQQAVLRAGPDGCLALDRRVGTRGEHGPVRLRPSTLCDVGRASAQRRDPVACRSPR